MLCFGTSGCGFFLVEVSRVVSLLSEIVVFCGRCFMVSDMVFMGCFLG